MDWITTVNGLIALITGLVSLISAGVAGFFAVRNFIRANKEKSAKEIWNLIMNMADAAMKQAEVSQKAGAEKKQMVIDMVKEGCKAAGVNIDDFLDQLSSYIDQAISFVNDMTKK